jgi:hypothetical protein
LPPGSSRRPNDLETSFAGEAYNFAFGELPSRFDSYIDEFRGFHLYGRTQVETIDELLGLLQLFHSRLRFFGTGGYTVTELKNKRIWLGTSAREFVQSLSKRKERYAGARIKRSHHSEEFSFYDGTRVGALFGFGRQNVSRGGLEVSFELILPGIPLDPEPLRAVMRAVGMEDHQLLPTDRRLIRRVELPRGGVLAEPLEYLRNDNDPQFISGAVIKNPFFEAERSDEIPEPLRSVSVLVGQVRDYLAEDERVTKFRIGHIDILTSREGWVVDVWLGHDEELRYRVPVEDGDSSKTILAKNPATSEPNPRGPSARRSK